MMSMYIPFRMYQRMKNLREYSLIGALMVLGAVLGVVYASTYGPGTSLTLADTPITVEDRMAFENMAIEIALSDPRVKELTEGKTVMIFASFYRTFHAVDDNVTTQDGGKLFHFEWDQKYRALVTIRYDDDTGYGVYINITDEEVGEPWRAVWEDGKYFKQVN